MTSKVLAQILTDYGNCKREGARHLVPSDVEASVYVAIGIEGLTVDRVTAFDLAPEIAVVITSRGERFAFDYADVRGVRFSGGNRAPGYSAST